MDWLVNILLATTCVVVLVQYVKPAKNDRPPLENVLRVGTRVQGLPDLKVSARTLVLYVRSSCRYCTASMPFYKTIAADAKNAGVRFIAVSDDPKEAATEYFNSHGVQPNDVLFASAAETGVPFTPALALLDGAGIITNSWLGKLPSEGETSVRRALSNSE